MANFEQRYKGPRKPVSEEQDSAADPFGVSAKQQIDPASAVGRKAPGAGSPDQRRSPESGWLNLQTYFDLNKTQAGAQADRIGQQVQQKGQKAQTDLEAAQAVFNAGLPAGSQGFGLKQMQTPVSQSQVLGGLGKTVPQGTRNPGEGLYEAGQGIVTSSQAKKMADADYNGPGSLLEMQPGLIDSIGDATAETDKLQSQEGIADLVRDSYGKGESYYGSGAQGLDAALTGMAGSGSDQWNNITSEYGGLDAAFGLADDRSRMQVDRANAYSAEGDRLLGQAQAREAAGSKARSKLGDDVRVQAEVKASREKDASLAGDRGRHQETSHVSDESYAQRNGVSLEEWIRAGRPQSQAQWEEYWANRKAVEAEGKPWSER